MNLINKHLKKKFGVFIDDFFFSTDLPNSGINSDRKPSPIMINNAVKKASENELKGILDYSDIPLVSTDILKNPHSSIYDASSTQILNNNHIKVVCWYDNEWGYSNRVVDLLEKLSKDE